MNSPSDLQRIYKQRFESKRTYREAVWNVLISDFFERYVSRTAAVLDLGCGYGEFIRLIHCGKKFAMDLNPDSKEGVPPECEMVIQDCSEPWPLAPATLDVVFSSNFFEHLPDKNALGRTLDHAQQALKPGGSFIALGPNITRVPGRYWDFWDHHIPLSEKSLGEALTNRGFRLRECRASFLPYTMEGKKEAAPWMIALYLKLPFLWPILGHQFLIVAEKQ
jgi:SAM-dependent methyltransferase